MIKNIKIIHTIVDYSVDNLFVLCELCEKFGVDYETKNFNYRE